MDVGNLLCDAASTIGRHFRCLEREDNFRAGGSNRGTRVVVRGWVGERLICSKMSKAVLGSQEAAGGFGRGN